MNVELESHPGFLLLRVAGDLRLWGKQGQESPLGTLHSQLEDAPERLVLNLTGVTNVDSLGIGAIVRMLIPCYKRHMDLKVVLPAGLAGEALRRVHVFDAWPEFPQEAEAIQAAGG